MITRRQLSTRALALGALPTLAACAPGDARPGYEEAARAIWRHGRVDRSGGAALRRELVRYATLAPSSHNSQCWRFAVTPEAIAIAPDLARRCPAVDPDDHHLFVSLGCAAENLVQAALAHGLLGHVSFEAEREAVSVALEATAAVATPMFQAIPTRQCTRADCDGQSIASQTLLQLEQAAAGSGVRLVLLTDKAAVERVLELVVQGNTAQMHDRAFVDELKAWIRFSSAAAVQRGDGLYAASSGNPVLPEWLGRRMFDLFFTPGRENDKYARQVRSSAGLAVFVGAGTGKPGWIEVGRACERFALQATALGIRTAHLNQPVEVASLGRGPTLPPSLRRPLQAVLA